MIKIKSRGDDWHRLLRVVLGHRGLLSEPARRPRPQRAGRGGTRSAQTTPTQKIGQTLVRRRRGFPRPRLIWRFESYGARRDRYGPARIDTIDEDGTVIATEPLADRITPYHATMLALERCVDSDIDGELHLAA